MQHGLPISLCDHMPLSIGVTVIAWPALAGNGAGERISRIPEHRNWRSVFGRVFCWQITQSDCLGVRHWTKGLLFVQWSTLADGSGCIRCPTGKGRYDRLVELERLLVELGPEPCVKYAGKMNTAPEPDDQTHARESCLRPLVLLRGVFIPRRLLLDSWLCYLILPPEFLRKP